MGWKGGVPSFFGFLPERAFEKIELIGPAVRPDKAVLMIGNHFSWWDGFIQYRLNEELYRKRFHVMMLEEQLVEHPVLNRGGAFSIRKQSREMIGSLRYAASLLEDPGNMVLLFPQGRIESIHREYLTFERGVEYLLARAGENAELVFNVNLIDYHERKKPSLYIYHQPVYGYGMRSAKEIEVAYNEFYSRCKHEQQKIWV
ncbi:MAG: lysophospholipid acyltransferase family protein [Tannerellaceae bacterium]|nr:lysophospholipid acyltransferase family protein [Tannerellaceae bacterium]